MKRFAICFNVFLLLFSGCNGLGGVSKTSKVRMALFVEQERGPNVQVVEMKVYRANPKVFFVAANPVLEVGKDTLEGAYLIEGQDKILSLQLRFNSRGSALLEDITTRFRQQRLFIVVAMPDKTDKKRIVSRCIGVFYVQNTITDKILQFTPDADEEEAIEIVNGLNKTIR
jgi:hypothetical protein